MVQGNAGPIAGSEGVGSGAQAGSVAVPEPVSASAKDDHAVQGSAGTMPETKPVGAGTKPGIAGGISIGSIKPQQVAVQPMAVDAKPLTQEDLVCYWDEVAVELGLEELMKSAEPHMGEHPGVIEIEAKTTWFADEFKAHRTEVMVALRKRSGLPMLDCKVTPMFVESDEVVYSPADKYNKMVERNPQLAMLRKMMPNIDY